MDKNIYPRGESFESQLQVAGKFSTTFIFVL